MDKFLKVWSCDRLLKKSVVARSFDDLVQKVIKKFDVPRENADLTFVIENDGTEIDEDVFHRVDENTTLMLLKKKEKWSPQGHQREGNEQEVSVGKLTRESVVKKLEDIRRKRLSAYPGKDEDSKVKKRRKETYQISFGWLRKHQKSGLKYVVPRQGGGARKHSVPRDATYDVILNTAKELYDIRQTTCYLGKFDGTPLGKEMTCERFVKDSNFLTLPRIYIITDPVSTSTDSVPQSDSEKEASEDTCEDANDDTSESDVLSLGKPHKGQSILDETLPLQIEFEDVKKMQISIANEENKRGETLFDDVLDEIDPNKYVPVYSRSAIVQLFVDIQTEPISQVETTYGPFYQIPVTLMDAFDAFRQQLKDDARFLHVNDIRLRYWMQTNKRELVQISNNVYEMSKEDDLSFQVFVDMLPKN